MTNTETLQLETKKHRLNLITSYAIYIACYLHTIKKTKYLIHINIFIVKKKRIKKVFCSNIKYN